jgi:hypothetical protein
MYMHILTYIGLLAAGYEIPDISSIIICDISHWGGLPDRVQHQFFVIYGLSSGFRALTAAVSEYNAKYQKAI